jgi:trimeric autotransporter adhesin
MKNLKTRLAVLLLSTLSLLTGAFAQFTPSQDSYTFSNKAGQNFGTAQTIQVEYSVITRPPTIANSYIQFDLSSIPSSYTGANVTKASLKLFVNTMGGAGSFNVDLANGSWTELGIKYNNAPTLGTTIASSIPLTAANVNHYVIVDVTSAVQAWLDAPQSNDGIALVANSGLGVLFDSKENTGTSHPPELDIVFASGGGTITGVTTSNGSGLIGGGDTGNLNLSLTNACSIGQVLAWNGASGGWVCSTVTGGGGGLTGTGTVNSLPLFNGTTSVTSSNVFQSASDTNVGIGTATPQVALDVNGAINSTAGFNIGETPFAFGSSSAQNAFLGFAANSTITGQFNTAVGFSAFLKNGSGRNDTAVGVDALVANTTGSYNTGIGAGALQANGIGIENTAAGDSALYSNTTGGSNTANGRFALFYNTTGADNTALGYLAGPDPTTPALNNSTAIGAYADVTRPNSLVLGGISNTGQCTAANNCASVNVGIGTTAPGFPLDVAGVIRSSTGGFMFPDGSVQTKAASGGGGSGTVTNVATGPGLTGGPITTSGTLTIDTSVVPLLTSSNTFNGSITASSFNGNGALLTNVNAATLGGFSPGTFATLGPNTFAGNQTITGSLFASGNVGIGTTTPQATLDVNGSVNLPNTTSATVGVLSLGGTPFLHNFGSQNTSVGESAGNLSTTGVSNTAFGSLALQFSTGSSNNAFGVFALRGTGTHNMQGSNNSAFGSYALYNNSTGNSNNAFGDGALNDLRTGDNNIAIGGGAGSNLAAGESNDIYIGHRGVANESNTIRIGDPAVQTTAYIAGTLNVASITGPGPSTIALSQVGVVLTSPMNQVNGPTIITGLTTIIGSTTVDGPLTVTGGCTGCGAGGGGITSVTGTNGVNATTSGGNVALSADQHVVAFQTDLSSAVNSAVTTAENFSVTQTVNYTDTYFLHLAGGAMTGTLTVPVIGVGTASPAFPLDVNGVVNTSTAYNLGGTIFDSGSPSSNNAFLGFAGNGTNPGTGNVAAGWQALAADTTGGSNVAVGYLALNGNTTGSFNVALGNYAGQTGDGSPLTGNNNTFLGGGAEASYGSNSSGAITNATAIGSNSVVGESNALVLGSIANLNGCDPNGTPACLSTMVGIGTTTPLATLDVEAPTGTPPPTVIFGSTSNQAVFTVNGSLSVTGAVTCGSGCSGGGGGGNGTVTKVATGIGLTGGPITTSGTLSIDTSVVPQLTGTNTFTGSNSFTGSTTAAAITATSLTASGSISAGGPIFAGSVSTFGTVGAASYTLEGTTILAHAPSTGGSLLLGENTGNSTLLSPNDFSSTTAIGDFAMSNYTSGFYNTALGNSALSRDQTGSSNTAAGYGALRQNTTGSNNTALGYNAGPDSASTGLSYSTAIGAGAVVSAPNAMALGGPQGSAAAVSVGIGTATPQATLDVVGGANFSGNLNVTGTLSKGAGTFKIDHPLDPANKYLYHSFVESPDMMNVYNGNIATDGSGLATVTLPDWFEALNRDFRYQLTVIGQFAQAIVASEVNHNQFTIRTDKPNVKVSWQVTGIRQDAYANAHRIQVEEDKPPQDQGHYLHPELFGAGPEQAVGYHAPTATFAAQAPVSTLHQ